MQRRQKNTIVASAAITKMARVFTGPNAQGNVCIVRCLPLPCSVVTPLPASIYTQCISQLKDNCIVVSCFTASGYSIDCCGHGLMATAALWYEYNTVNSFLTLQMNGSQVQWDEQSGCYGLHFTRIHCTPSDIPLWLAQFFTNKPVYCATAGSDSGYLVLEWPENFNLRALISPGPALESVTQRAIIVTCLNTHEKDNSASIQFRYFAPQYGTCEDSATGSALRILADYWHQRCAIDTLDAYQCSSQGGLLHSQITNNNSVIVSGAVEWLS